MGKDARRLEAALAVCICGALLVATPAVASAANRYASPTGSGSEPCDISAPCPIDIAINGAASGDDVSLASGNYTTNTPMVIADGVTVHGVVGAAPTINVGDPGPAIKLSGAGSTLRDVDVEYSGINQGALDIRGGLVERVVSHVVFQPSSSAQAACGVVVGSSTIRDSVCWSSAPTANGAGVRAFAGTGIGLTLTLRNVTAISDTSVAGLRGDSSPFGALTVNATNVIAKSAGPADVSGAQIAGGGTVAMNLDHSNYATQSDDPPNGITVTDPGTGTNVTTAPAFVNAATGDFHQTSSSMGTLDLGTAMGLQPLEQDIDGQYRKMGSAPDIGADERAVAPPAPTITATDPPSGSNENNPLVIGSAEPFSFVNVYASADCSGSRAGGEVADEFASPGIIVTVPDDSTTSLTATATNGAGPSICSAPFTYAEVTHPQQAQPPPAGPGPSQVPANKKKKCKKKKHRAAAAKKCKKRK
jgi:hypothetical protein